MVKKWLQRDWSVQNLSELAEHLSDTAYCDMITDGGGWLVVLRRVNGTENFNRRLVYYRRGFGNPLTEFWFGLLNLNRYHHTNHELRVDLEDWDGQTAYAKYLTFRVATGFRHFRLTVGGYSGTAGDSFSSANGMNFTTSDSDLNGNENANCAQLSKGGWLFNNCFQALCTGPYSHLPQGGNGIIWKTWRGFQHSLKKCEMKIRPREI